MGKIEYHELLIGFALGSCVLYGILQASVMSRQISVTAELGRHVAKESNIITSYYFLTCSLRSSTGLQ